MTAARPPQSSSGLDRHEGKHLFSAAEALVKGVLEADTAVELVTGSSRGAFGPVFELGNEPSVTALLDRHGTTLLETPTAGRAIALSTQRARSGHRAVTLVPNEELDLAMPALEAARALSLHRGGAVCLVFEDDPYGSAASDPRLAAVRLDLPCLAPDGVDRLRLSIEDAMRLSRSVRAPAAIVVHRWVLRSADTIEARANRVLDPLVSATVRPRRPARWAESGDLLKVARRLELNRFHSVPVRGEKLPLSFVVAGPAAASVNHVLHRLGLAGRVPVLELGLVNPIDESVVERVLRHSQEVVVLESRPGSIEADVLRVAEGLRRRLPADSLARVSSQPITDEPNPALRADEALHPSILARRIVPLLTTSHPKLKPPFAADPPKLASPPATRGRELGAAGALHRVRDVLADIDQWLRDRSGSGEEPDRAPTALAVDGAEPDHAAGHRVLTVETWTDRRFLVDGIASLRQAAWDDRPWMFIVCALGNEEVSDLVRLAQGAIPSRRAHGARIESANLNDRSQLRELLQTLTTTTRLSMVVVHDGPPPRYDIAAMELDCADIDRLGYEPRQLVVLSAQGNCAIRRSFDIGQPQRPVDGVAPLRSQLKIVRPSRGRRDGPLRFRLRPMYEAVEVVRERPPAAAWRRSAGPRLELPKPVHALAAQWRAHLAGFRGAGPGVAATAMCEAGRRMGYQVRCLHDPTPIGRGRRAWSQVLFTRPQGDKGPLPITARIPFGEADLLLGLDSAESLRAIDAAGSLRVAHLDTTYAVANVGAFGDEDEPEERAADTAAALRAVSRDDIRLVEDLAAVARSVFHTDRVTDLVVLGLAYQLGLVPVSHEAIEGGVQAVEDQGFGRAMEAFQFGRRLATRGVARPREAEPAHRTDVDRLARRTVRLLRCGRINEVDVDQFAELLAVTLERTPGLTETDAGREARRDLVMALHRLTLWGGLEHAGRYAELIIRLYRADRGDTGRALTRNAVLPLAESMLIRDPVYIATLVMSAGHRRRARRWLNVKTARGDRLTRRFLTRVEIGAAQRRLRLDLRTSDWTAWLAAKLRDRIPVRWRGTRHDREIRDHVIDIVEQATESSREDYDYWSEALQRLHTEAAHDRLFGMALSELKMLVER